MKSILLILTLITAGFASEYKAIFNLTSAEEKTVSKSVLENISALDKHYQAQGDSFKAVVIISGGAYKYFIEDIDNSPYAKETGIKASQIKLRPVLESLVKKGVVFEMCGMGMKKHSIDKKVIYPFVKPVFNRSASLIEWQSRGYSLIIVN